MAGRKHKLSLLDNSHSFMGEATRKAIAARDDVSQWPFAILNLVQATELSLKELLRRQHPILIYDNIDNPRNTVSINQALNRIERPDFVGIKIPDSERKKIKTATDLRNKITHFEFEISEEYAMAKFSEMFAFLVYFQGHFLNVEVEDIIQEDLFRAVIEIEECSKELHTKAIQRIKVEKIGPDFLWECPHCGEETFVIKDDSGVCFYCRQAEEITVCPYCDEPRFLLEMVDFSDCIEYDRCDGRYEIVNDYGYSHPTACTACIGDIQDDIEQQKADKFHQMMEEEFYYDQKRRYHK